MTELSQMVRPLGLQGAQSVEAIDLNDDATAKDQEESTPMSNMDEAAEETETNADAGGDAEEFRSNSDDNCEYQTKEFQEQEITPATNEGQVIE